MDEDIIVTLAVPMHQNIHGSHTHYRVLDCSLKFKIAKKVNMVSYMFMIGIHVYNK